jgi:hypothetical protein
MFDFSNMIKLFDFKFLILLGLTLIVYFIYREVEHQRVRINECENKIAKLLSQEPLPKQNQLINYDGTIQLPPPPQQEQQLESSVSSPVLSPSSPVSSHNNNLSIALPENIKQNIQDIIYDIEDSSTKETTISENEKHLEIYSNVEKLITESPSTSEIKSSLENNGVELLKLKLPELQKLAKNKDISLDKKVNGVSKKKTKQELVDEISKKNI